MRQSRRGRSGKLPPFVPLTWEMLNSAAYKELSPSAAKGLPYFLGKVKTKYNDPQKYLSEFSFSYTEADRLGFAITTFYRVISRLMANGFIDPVDKGGLRGLCRSYNLFKLSNRWMNYGTPAFNKIEEWRCFKPDFRTKSTPKMEMATASKMKKSRPN